ncbi:MAG: type I polyketide synthase, partial [Pseudomonadota bacterium]
MNDRPSTDQRALLQRALLTIDRLEAKLAEERAARREPIAIVGMGCRFPGGADTPEAFWELVREGRDAVTEVPKERWDVDAIFDPDPDAIGKTYTRWGAFIDDFNWFDPTFFGITRREARSIDPQQRLLLETTWEALEYGGIAPSSLAGSRGGVFVGVTGHDFSLIGAEALSHLKADAYGASGGAHSIASGRISYLLGLHGPNFALDTACSSSMVAIHCGVRALREGDADLVLAGGVTMTLSASGSIVTSRARMMSFDGRCKTFDAAADGYVRGEGCAMLAMKRLSDAERDGDRIVAVIRGTAINQDGRSTGMTAPNGRAQTAVLRAALDDAGLTPRDVNYIEAHGTGTSLGDPIELNALGEAYGDRPADEPLHVASVKTNIGHTEGAAGIAGVIKTAMAMRAREIAPHLNLETPNPLIPWDSLPVEVPLALTPWQAPAEGRLRAGVSSFGFSGTNAHLVMEEAPEPAVEADEADRPGREHTLLALSGRAREAVDAMAGRLAAHMEAHPEIGVGAVAAELGLGRSHLNQRLALPVNGRADALAKLQAAARGETPEGAARDNVRGGEAPATVFLFTGQGSQYAGMARELYDGEPVFRAALDRCAAALEGKLPRPLLPVVFGETSEDAALLDDTTYTQPALFAVEWSLAELWKSWGVVPAAAMGHSVGEYVAACVAGVFSLEDGLALIAERARLMGSLPRDG